MKQNPNPGDRFWGVYLAVFVAVSAAFLARTPAGGIRERPFSTLGFIVVVGCCGVAAEALWSRRPWRDGAVDATTVAVLLTGLARGLERSPAETVGQPFLMPEWLANAPLFFLVLYLLTNRWRGWHKLRVPRS